MLAGTAAGVWLVKFISQILFSRITYVLLLLSGILAVF